MPVGLDFSASFKKATPPVGLDFPTPFTKTMSACQPCRGTAATSRGVAAIELRRPGTSDYPMARPRNIHVAPRGGAATRPR